MTDVIEVFGLSKSYFGRPVIENMDITVSKGEVYGLLGANGSGKTTAIECMLGTRKADAGSISILGLNPRTARKQLFEKVGVQFQEANYADRIRVDELCEETACLYKDSVDYKILLQKFGLMEKQKAAVSQLSGGQRQRLFIILALIPDPEVVFLDELTTGLDAKARRGVWNILQDLKKQGMTIFLTSHFMDEVENLCDRIGVIKDGRLAFSGTVKEFVKMSPYEKMEDAYLWFTKEEDGCE
ncbi:ABC transporter ATP-binding protein [Clostridium sp. chh4-2]|uniref:ABC transporter ATP-binding protein n=1 Tax=Clostridium sp. chh4-2 TaxID=2067550 RepID=UPI000CCE90A8|nr:ABC transporter ATP-binding protein [Clostridium sp. chh4-2]PNV63276.1 ABC transporter ATP-binding protein [Clostridium sp. chh4-2]